MPAALALAHSLALAPPGRALTPASGDMLLMLFMLLMVKVYLTPARLRRQCVVEPRAVLRAMARNLNGRDA
jgi:hypothetical protein